MAAATHRRRTTHDAQAVHARLAVSSRRMRGHSIRLPAFDSTTGSNVMATATLTAGMSRPANPMLRRNGTGSTTSARRPMATVMPEATTALPAVAIARTTASSPSAPRAFSSRHRVTMSSA